MEATVITGMVFSELLATSCVIGYISIKEEMIKARDIAQLRSEHLGAS